MKGGWLVVQDVILRNHQLFYYLLWLFSQRKLVISRVFHCIVGKLQAAVWPFQTWMLWGGAAPVDVPRINVQIFSNVVSNKGSNVSELRMSFLLDVLGTNRFIYGLHRHQCKQQEWGKHRAQWLSGEQRHHQDYTSVCTALQAKGRFILNLDIDEVTVQLLSSDTIKLSTFPLAGRPVKKSSSLQRGQLWESACTDSVPGVLWQQENECWPVRAGAQDTFCTSR